MHTDPDGAHSTTRKPPDDDASGIDADALEVYDSVFMGGFSLRLRAIRGVPRVAARGPPLGTERYIVSRWASSPQFAITPFALSEY